MATLPFWLKHLAVGKLFDISEPLHLELGQRTAPALQQVESDDLSEMNSVREGGRIA